MDSEMIDRADGWTQHLVVRQVGGEGCVWCNLWSIKQMESRMDRHERLRVGQVAANHEKGGTYGFSKKRNELIRVSALDNGP
jgi:hypothetical protein